MLFRSFALRLAEKSRVSAYDSDAGAIAALQKAVASTAGLKPIKAETRDLFRRPLVAEELRDFDAIVFDPPRQGAQAQAERLAGSKVAVVIAVSCNVATFARDARILIDGGYKIEGVTPVDQFRHTPHVELVARFKRERAGFNAKRRSVSVPTDPAISFRRSGRTSAALCRRLERQDAEACGRRPRAKACFGSLP